MKLTYTCGPAWKRPLFIVLAVVDGDAAVLVLVSVILRHEWIDQDSHRISLVFGTQTGHCVLVL